MGKPYVVFCIVFRSFDVCNVVVMYEMYKEFVVKLAITDWSLAKTYCSK